jgi:hypothetical protein
MNYVNSDKIKVYKVFADDSIADLCYGVETEYTDTKENIHIEWFKTQEEQDREYHQCIAEISRGEWN